MFRKHTATLTLEDRQIFRRVSIDTETAYQLSDMRDSLRMTADVYLKPYTGSRVRERIARQVSR